MKIIEFSYIDKNDLSNNKRQARSRCYEYPFVLNFLKEYGKYNIIHNTGCGGGDIHIKFANELEKYGNVINSDVEGIRGEKKPNEFMLYDIMEGGNISADITLCISTLEHLDDQVLALKNLLDNTNDGGYVVVTLDSPPVQLEILEEFLGEKCKDVEERLTPQNSICKHPEWDGINIIKLIIQK